MNEQMNGIPKEVFDMGGLILKYLQGEINVQERALLDAWIAKSENNKKLFDELTHKDLLHDRLAYYYNTEERKAAAGNKMMKFNFSRGAAVRRMRGDWRKVMAAAAVLLLLVSGAYFWVIHEKGRQVVITENQDEQSKNDVAPGKDGAILKLANGRMIVLDSVANGNLARQGNTQVMKNGAVVAYDAQGDAPATQNIPGEILYYNTLTTLRGRQFQLALPDGSKVWLNAASSITFPTAFVGKVRKVEITGEVYFEVKGEIKPFIVSANGMEVEVLGTHFNVNAYDDEVIIKTTLLEGSVKVVSGQSSVVIKPGQQARIAGGSIQQRQKISVVNDIDAGQVVAWKNGSFQFNDESLETIMRQLARWYDVKITYEGKKPDIHFAGIISRNTNLSEVLRMLELSGVRFKINEKEIIVIPST